MLTINTIRYGTDDFAMTKKELTYSITPLDCTGASSVTGFTLTSSVPSGTDVRAAFQIGGTWYKLVGPGSATLSALPTQAITTDSVLAEGNTVAELAAITGIAAFAGQSVNVAIALMAPGDATAMPYLGIVVNGVARLINEVAKDVPVTTAGGTEDNGVGTSFEKILTAFEENKADAGICRPYLNLRRLLIVKYKL